MRQLSLPVDRQPVLPFTSINPITSKPHACGSLTEVIVSDDSAIQPMQLLPMLAHCNASDRWLMWLSPNRTLNKRSLADMNLDKAPVIHIDLQADTQQLLCQRILNSGNSHLIIEWQGNISQRERRRLHSLARQSGSHVVLVQVRPNL